MIGGVVEAIAAARVVCDPVPPQGEESMDLQVNFARSEGEGEWFLLDFGYILFIFGTHKCYKEYYEQFEKNRKTVVEELVRKYKTIGPLLGKIEGITDDSTTQRLPKMKSYYKFWERRIFNALNKVWNNIDRE
jgi:hypothetical protein